MRPIGFSRESIVGLIVALAWLVVHYRFPRVEVDFLVIVGAVVLALVFETIIRVHRVANGVQAIQRDAARANTEIAARLGEALDAGNHDLSVLRFAVHTVPASEINEVWHTLLSGMRHRYVATSLVKREFLYDQEWGNAALDIQRAKLHYQHASIQKVFVIDTPGEGADWRDVWQRQADAGICVRYIVRSLLDRIKTENPAWAALNNGFGLFDDRIALLWITDEVTRKNTAAKIELRNQDIADYNGFFRMLYGSATEFSGARS